LTACIDGAVTDGGTFLDEQPRRKYNVITLQSEVIMRVDIVPIGNSRGIRIPKALLEQCGFAESVEIKMENNRLVLSPSARLRSGWDEAFRAMAAKQDDALLHTPATTFDEGEWQW
jgi:antitoxin MazE